LKCSLSCACAAPEPRPLPAAQRQWSSSLDPVDASSPRGQGTLSMLPAGQKWCSGHSTHSASASCTRLCSQKVPEGQGRQMPCDRGWKPGPQTHCSMAILPEALIVLALLGHAKHRREPVLFWNVSGGHSAYERVRLLPRNLPMAQALHSWTATEARLNPRRQTQSSGPVPHGLLKSSLLSTRRECAGPPASGSRHFSHGTLTATQKCPAGQN